MAFLLQISDAITPTATGLSFNSVTFSRCGTYLLLEGERYAIRARPSNMGKLLFGRCVTRISVSRETADQRKPARKPEHISRRENRRGTRFWERYYVGNCCSDCDHRRHRGLARVKEEGLSTVGDFETNSAAGEAEIRGDLLNEESRIVHGRHGNK
jgi:hypothetical protein